MVILDSTKHSSDWNINTVTTCHMVGSYVVILCPHSDTIVWSSGLANNALVLVGCLTLVLLGQMERKGRSGHARLT